MISRIFATRPGKHTGVRNYPAKHYQRDYTIRFCIFLALDALLLSRRNTPATYRKTRAHGRLYRQYGMLDVSYARICHRLQRHMPAAIFL